MSIGNAPGLRGPEDDYATEDYLELVARYMEEGMSQDDAEIAAVCEMERLEELRALDNLPADFDDELHL